MKYLIQILSISLFVTVWLPGRCEANAPRLACQRHYERALRLHGERSYAQAIESFEAAYRICKQPGLLVNIGRCYYYLQQPEQSLRYYALYKQQAPRIDPEDRAKLEIFIGDASALEHRLHRQPVPLSGSRRIAAGILGGLLLLSLTTAITLNVLDGHDAGACRFARVDYNECQYSFMPHFALGYALSGALAGGLILTLTLPLGEGGNLMAKHLRCRLLICGLLLAGCDGGPFAPVRPKPSSWSRAVLGSDTIYANSIWGTGPSDVWVVGYKGVVHGDGKNWSLVSDHTNLAEVWGSGSGDVWVSSYGANWMALGELLHCTSGCSPLTITTEPRSLHSGWSGQVRDYWVLSETQTDQNAVLRGDGTTWMQVYQAEPMVSLSSIWGLDPADLWIAGSGVVIHYHQGTWTPKKFDGIFLSAIWGSSAADIWAVGGTGANGGHSIIMHWDGSTWSRDVYEGEVGESLTSIWGSSARDIWAGGGVQVREPGVYTGVMVHWDGASWTRDPSLPRSGRITDLWGSGPQDLWAADRDTSLLHYSPSHDVPALTDGGTADAGRLPDQR